MSVAPGTLVIASGNATDRKLLAATLGGRLDPLSGRAQVAGHPLPSESGPVSRLVALEDVGGSDRVEVRVGVGDLLLERISLTQPWYRGGRHRQVRAWVARINTAIGALEAHLEPVNELSGIDQLPQLQRAVALSAVALAENTPVVMLDQLDAFANPTDEAAFLKALDDLAPATTTIVLGTPVTPREYETAGLDRHVARLDLHALRAWTLEQNELSRKAALA